MIRNYFTAALRNLRKHPAHSLLNIFGLAIGLAAAAQIFLWVEDERGWDRFNTRRDHLYFVRVNEQFDKGVFTHGSSPGVLGPALQAEIPGIANTCRSSEGEQPVLFTIGGEAGGKGANSRGGANGNGAGGAGGKSVDGKSAGGKEADGGAAAGGNGTVEERAGGGKKVNGGGGGVGETGETGEKAVYASGIYAEASLFDLFTLPFAEGDAKTAFSQLYSLVITEKTARKFFGVDRGVVGRTVQVDRNQHYTISGVIKDIPENSTLQFEWAAPFQIYYQRSPWTHEWGSNCLSTYVELKPGADVAAINRQMYNFVQQRAPTSIAHVFLQGMDQWRLYDQFDNGKPTGGGRIEYVRLFSIIAGIILLIACINFMNLATARSEKRAREVGVRKVLGAGKRGLVLQFLGESLLFGLLAAGAAVFFVLLTLPAFNLLVEKNLTIGWDQPSHWAALLTITLVCGLIAGSYPSLYLSSFHPAAVLKGLKLKAGSAVFIRKGLVVLQFTASMVLIIGTLVIYRQIQHVKDRNLGFDKDHLVEMNLQGSMAAHFDAIRQDLAATGLVQSVALSDHPTLYGGNNTDDMTWEGKQAANKILISWRNVSTGFFATSGMRIVEGRDFEATDTINMDLERIAGNVIITESTAKLMGKGSPLGRIIYDEHDTAMYVKVVGVVNDFVYGSMYEKPDPVVFFCVAPRRARVLYARTRPGSDPSKVLAGLEEVMKKNNPGYPFQYRFVDDQFSQLFQSEALVSKLSRVFAALAILISCLGLFGLAAYTAERRTREIGIRKVLGASVPGLAGLLSLDFIRLILLSAVVSFPLAWWIMHSWLQGYAYRTEIAWWIFPVAFLLTLFIALVTISWQAIRAALASPVKSLRSE